MGRKRIKPDCEGAFRTTKARPQSIRPGATLTKYAPENQRKGYLCAFNYSDEEGFLTCQTARRRGLCKNNGDMGDGSNAEERSIQEGDGAISGGSEENSGGEHPQGLPTGPVAVVSNCEEGGDHPELGQVVSDGILSIDVPQGPSTPQFPQPGNSSNEEPIDVRGEHDHRTGIQGEGIETQAPIQGKRQMVLRGATGLYPGQVQTGHRVPDIDPGVRDRVAALGDRVPSFVGHSRGRDDHPGEGGTLHPDTHHEILEGHLGCMATHSTGHDQESLETEPDGDNPREHLDPCQGHEHSSILARDDHRSDVQTRKEDWVETLPPRSEKVMREGDLQGDGGSASRQPSVTPRESRSDPEIHRGGHGGRAAGDGSPRIEKDAKCTLGPPARKESDVLNVTSRGYLAELEKVQSSRKEVYNALSSPQTGGILAKEHEAGERWLEFLAPDHVREHLSEVFRY